LGRHTTGVNRLVGVLYGTFLPFKLVTDILLGILFNITSAYPVYLLLAFSPYIIQKAWLVQEKEASKYGNELLKEWGASDRYLKMAKVTQGAAYDTYKDAAFLNCLSGLLLMLGIKIVF
jgi:hypothetical protein